MSEKPERCAPRRLAEWLNPTGAKKVHSLIDKVYQRKNLEIAWEKVKANRGAGGVDGESIASDHLCSSPPLRRVPVAVEQAINEGAERRLRVTTI